MQIAAAVQPTGATEQADASLGHLAAALVELAAEGLVRLLAALGPQGVAVLLAVAAVVMTCKSKAVRRAEARALRAALRHGWRLLVWLVARLRNARRPVLTATKEERKLLARLAPAHWRDHADARGLDGTLTARPRLTDAGIVAAVRLDGTWTVGKLRAAEDNVRALLGARTALRVEVTPGSRGGWAELVIRTRSAVDDADMKWAPGRAGIGLDTHTGKAVAIPLDGRLLLAGSSGAGKSVTLRPALAEVAADPRAAVVMVDLKRVEGALWRDRARIARTAAEVELVAVELVAEMMARLEELEAAGRASWTPTVERPRLVVVVDEGAEVSAVAKDAMPNLESLARMGRAAEIHLWWCTQKPTMSGSSAGIPPQIAAQMDVRLCLRVATATEVRTVLGEDATAGGWDAHTLPKPGVLMIRGTGRGPAPVRVWFMDDDQVRALPAAPVWQHTAAPSTTPPVDFTKPPAAGGSGQPRACEAAPDPVPVDPVAAALAALAEAGPEGASAATVQAAAGLGKSRAYDLLAALLADGRVVRVRHGRYAPNAAAGEAA